MLVRDARERSASLDRRYGSLRIGERDGNARRRRGDPGTGGLQCLADGAFGAIRVVLIRGVRRCAVMGMSGMLVSAEGGRRGRIGLMDVGEVDRLALGRRDGDGRQRLDQQRKNGDRRRDGARPRSSFASFRIPHAAVA